MHLNRYHFVFIVIICLGLSGLVFLLQPKESVVSTPTANLAVSEPAVVTSTTQPIQSPTLIPQVEIQATNTNFTVPDPAPADHDQTRHLIALRAATLAAKSMPGPYSWEEYRSCSTFASAYLKQLSFPVADLCGKYADHPYPFPFSSVITQVDWFRNKYPQYVHDQSLDNFLNGRLWSEIPIGSLIYLQNAEGHNGYNTYYHVVVLVDYYENEPTFAEIAGGMSNVSTDRSFEQITKFYKRYADDTWDTTPYPTGKNEQLLVTWVDPLEILNLGELWRQDIPVTPNADFLSSMFDQVVTVNINNGLLSVFTKSDTGWQQVNIDGRTEFYAVVGRRLPANNTITQSFSDRQTDIYDGDYGVYISSHGVYQDTWTPPLVSELTGFERLANFGGIGGSTDTSLLVPLVYNNQGQIEHYSLNSSFTFHLIPDVQNQDTLLRTDLISQANLIRQPVSKPDVYLSSGCINFDKATWLTLKTYLQTELNKGQKIAVVFSYPYLDQNLLPYTNLSKAPFTGAVFSKWCPENNFLTPCDPYDRRNYRDTYLTKENDTP